MSIPTLESDEERMRRKVLAAWGSQERPMVLAPLYEQGLYWLAKVGDDFLTNQGSYRQMVVTPASEYRLRGWRGTLVIVIPDHRPNERRPDGWHDVLMLVGTLPGVSTWTERLP